MKMCQQFPFESVPHKRYRNTFLKSVQIAFVYSPIDEHRVPSDFKKCFAEFMSTTFGLALQENTLFEFWNHGISVSNIEHTATWFLGNRYFIVNLGIEDYISFVDSILPQAFKMRKFISDVLRQDIISEIHLRKVNVWQFAKPNEGFDIDAISKSVFSASLLEKKTNCSLDEYETHLDNIEKISFNEGDKSVIIKHLNLSHDETDTVAFILDSDASKAGSIQIQKVEDELISLNSLLFNAFHWSVSSRILNIMDGKED